MQSAELETLSSEASAGTPDAFAKLHPGVAIVVEIELDEEGEPPPPAAVPASPTGVEPTRDPEEGAVTLRFSRSAFKRALEPAQEPARKTRTRVFWPGADERSLLRIGRDLGSEIALTHPRISKRHASVQRVGGAGELWVARDEGSSNGSLLNDRPIERGQLALLGEGDRLVLGRAVTVRLALSPQALFHLVRTDRDKAKEHATRRIDVEQLARTICSLAANAEGLRLEFRAVAAGAPPEPTDVRVTTEPAVIAVEWGRDGRYHQRRTLARRDARALDSVRQFLLEALHRVV